MKIAIPDYLLDAPSIVERFQLAQQLGADGVEIWADRLDDDRLMAIAYAIDVSGLPVACLNMGEVDGFIDPNPAVRDQAVDTFRQALTDAHDLKADVVVFRPQINRPLLPDPSPDLLVAFLRVINDLAGAMDIYMSLLPAQPIESTIVHTIAEGMGYLQRINTHPAVKLAIDTHHAQMMGDDWGQALRDYTAHIAYVQVSGEGRTTRLENTDVQPLSGTPYSGWVALASGLPSYAPTRGAVKTSLLTDNMTLLRAVIGH